jgi:hypothetical protein
MNQAALEHTATPSPPASGDAGSTVSRKGAPGDAHLCLPAPVGAQHLFAQSQRQVGKSGITRVTPETSNETRKTRRKRDRGGKE